MRIFGCEIFSYKPIIFGDLVAKQLVVFEHKKLFGIIFFYFSGNEQDRFHTHAFNALSIKLFGKYTEGIIEYDQTKLPLVKVKYEDRINIFKYFPRDCYHSINNSKGCLTMLIQGPWKEKWKECKIKKISENQYEIIEEQSLTWHRQLVK